jgi:hypothetical protein
MAGSDAAKANTMPTISRFMFPPCEERLNIAGSALPAPRGETDGVK